MSVVCGFTGFTGILNMSCFAYPADTVVERNKLTIRMTYFSGCVSFGTIIASVIGSFIADSIPMMYYNLLSISCLLGLLIYITLWIRQLNPVQMKQMCTEKSKVVPYMRVAQWQTTNRRQRTLRKVMTS